MLSLIVVSFVVAACVVMHYEVLTLLNRTIVATANHRVAILITMFGLLTAHVVQIWVFALGYVALAEWLSAGTITGLRDWFDYVYYSSVVYTTLGFGDLIPTGHLRLLTAAESLTGLALIAWSATFTLAMGQKYWDR